MDQFWHLWEEQRHYIILLIKWQHSIGSGCAITASVITACCYFRLLPEILLIDSFLNPALVASLQMPRRSKGSSTWAQDAFLESLSQMSELKMRLQITGDVLDWGESPRAAMTLKVLSKNCYLFSAAIYANGQSEGKVPSVGQLQKAIDSLLTMWFLSATPQSLRFNAWGLKRLLTMARRLRVKGHMPRATLQHSR